MKYFDMCWRIFRRVLVISGLILGTTTLSFSQNAEDEDQPYRPIVINLNEDGSQYVRFLMWHQVWLTSQNLSSNEHLQLNPSIRRSRFLAYAQVSPNFLILTHWGLNGLTASNMTSLGNNGDGPQLFLHGAWGEIKINDHVQVGGGLHYWNGLTRLSSQSTITFMTLDQSRPFTSWHSLGITDQFARHLGVYAKGSWGNFDYRLAVNAPIHDNMGAGKDYGIRDSGLTYDGIMHNDAQGNAYGNSIFTGYFRYNLFDQESTLLPYNTGTYLGNKRIVALGAGFFLHPKGMFNSANGQHSNVNHFAVDAFVEWPAYDGAVHVYTSYINFNYGKNYVSRWAGTGKAFYGQLGYLYKPFKLMPYVAYNHGDYEGMESPVQTLDFGINYFLKGHNTKLTLEYHHIKGDIREAQISSPNDALSQIRLQMQLFI